jgi:hypothetical protein
MFTFYHVVHDHSNKMLTFRAKKRCPSGRIKDYHIIRCGELAYRFFDTLEPLDGSTAEMLETQLRELKII